MTPFAKIFERNGEQFVLLLDYDQKTWEPLVTAMFRPEGMGICKVMVSRDDYDFMVPDLDAVWDCIQGHCESAGIEVKKEAS